MKISSVDGAEQARITGSQPRALIGWRLLALLYDLWPAVALWMLAGTAFTLAYTIAGHDPRQNIAPFSALQLLLWLVCWLLTGAYAVWSWRRGGQTLGMRPWRLRVTAGDGGRAGLRALCLRYAIGTLSVLLGGLGFWWAWVDRGRLTWHDRISGTRMVREAKTRPSK
ncbi:RDD family protein [Luteimonas cucumeris]|nr:RDD family protein [Luteimonas cucumeris]